MLLFIIRINRKLGLLLFLKLCWCFLGPETIDEILYCIELSNFLRVEIVIVSCEKGLR